MYVDVDWCGVDRVWYCVMCVYRNPNTRIQYIYIYISTDASGNPRPKARRRQGPASSSGKNASGSGTESHGGSFPVTDDNKTILYSSFPQGASSSDRADFGGEEESSSASR